MERLDKILANTGHWSRKEVKQLVREGRVTVDGNRPVNSEAKFDRDAIEVWVDSELVVTAQHYYLMLHKPAGLVSATEDLKQETVLSLLPPHLRRVNLFPVGRLDKDTEGLLLLTNDGDLAHQLLSPKKHVDKVYYVEVDGVLNPNDVTAFEGGLTLDDGLQCLPAGLEILEDAHTGLVTLREGKFHQVKRMLAYQGKPVLYLKRLSMGTLVLDKDLEKGQWRPLTAAELGQLRP